MAVARELPEIMMASLAYHVVYALRVGSRVPVFPLLVCGLLANTSAHASQELQPQSKQSYAAPIELAGSFQHSVTKSTDANEITIELNTVSTTGHTLAVAASDATVTEPLQSVTGAKAPAKRPQANRAEQIGLFRIYRSNLLKLTYQHVIYPESAIERNQQGDVILVLIVNRSGDVKKIEFGERAAFSSLNRAAEQAVKNAKRSFPAAPSRLSGESFEVTMPIKFRLAG